MRTQGLPVPPLPAATTPCSQDVRNMNMPMQAQQRRAEPAYSVPRVTLPSATAPAIVLPTPHASHSHVGDASNAREYRTPSSSAAGASVLSPPAPFIYGNGVRIARGPGDFARAGIRPFGCKEWRRHPLVSINAPLSATVAATRQDGTTGGTVPGPADPDCSAPLG